MASESEKQRRKVLLNGVKAAQRASAEAALPAPKHHLQAMFDWVDEHLDEDCDHSLRLTVAFIKANGLEEERIVGWLREHGGYCDCEVVMNVEDSCAAFR